MVTIGPRVYYAMAKNKAFFHGAANVNPRWHTPVVAILSQGVCAMAMTLTPFRSLLTYIGIGLTFFSVLAVASLFVLPRPAPRLAAAACRAGGLAADSRTVHSGGPGDDDLRPDRLAGRVAGRLCHRGRRRPGVSFRGPPRTPIIPSLPERPGASTTGDRLRHRSGGVTYIDRVAISRAAPSIMRDLGLSKVAMGGPSSSSRAPTRCSNFPAGCWATGWVRAAG